MRAMPPHLCIVFRFHSQNIDLHSPAGGSDPHWPLRGRPEDSDNNDAYFTFINVPAQ